MSEIDELRLKRDLLKEVKELYEDITQIALSDKKHSREISLFQSAIDLIAKKCVIYGTYKDKNGKHLILTRLADGSSISFKVEEIEPRDKYENFHPDEMF